MTWAEFLDEPLVAVLATLRTDGSVLLSPVWHEWRDGAFNVWVEADNVKVRHLRRDPRASLVVAESEPPLRGVELRGTARFSEEGLTQTAPDRGTICRRGGSRSRHRGSAGGDLIIRIEPGHLRAWDYGDEFDRE